MPLMLLEDYASDQEQKYFYYESTDCTGIPYVRYDNSSPYHSSRKVIFKYTIENKLFYIDASTVSVTINSSYISGNCNTGSSSTSTVSKVVFISEEDSGLKIKYDTPIELRTE